jgi:CBS domain-containing protein
MAEKDAPTPVENKGSKPYRIYADVYGDPESHSHRPVTDAMCAVTICAAPNVLLWQVRELLERQRLPGVPVIGPDDRLLGIVTWRDLFTSPSDHRAAEVMQRALAFPARTPLGKAAAIMSSENIDLAIVVDFERRVLGLLSALDIVRWFAREDGYVLSRRVG